MKTAVPWTMVIVRVLMGPGIVALTMWGVTGRVLSVIVIAMLLDDIADGMVARRFGTDTPRLRLADSCADTVFYLGTAVAMWMRAPLSLWQNVWLIAVLFVLEAGRYLLDFAKFGKATSYHSYLAKAWGLVLVVVIVAVLVHGGPAWLVTVAAGLGVIVNLEGVAMSLMLPRWQNDVKTLAVAMRIRASLTQAAGEGR